MPANLPRHYSPFGTFKELLYAYSDAGETIKYKFGLNSQEEDDEIVGEGNIYKSEVWEYDARLGRRWNLDPIFRAWESGNATLRINPLFNIDRTGLEVEPSTKIKAKTHNLRKDDPYGSALPGLQYNYADDGDTSKYRFGFNTQERDDEIAGVGNIYTAEFWEYDARLGRRWNLDPKPNPSISIYACLLNNPIYFIDKSGDTTYRFDKSNNGKYIGIYNTDEFGQFGSYGAFTKTKIGNKTLELWDGEVFAFADGVNDPKQIRDGIINKLVYVKNDDIKSILTSQGAFNYKDKNNYWEFYNNSTGGQKFDYSFSVIPIKFASEGASSDPLNKPSPILFLPEGDNIAHNHMNFGNYLWAASGYALGFDKNTLKDAAHANSLLNSRKNGYKSQFDSKDDQYSISMGADHALKYKYRNIMEARHKAELVKKSKKKKR